MMRQSTQPGVSATRRSGLRAAALAAVAGALFLPSLAHAARLPHVGDTAADFALTSQEGSEYRLSEHLRDRRVVLVFLSIPCRACEDSAPAIDKLCSTVEPMPDVEVARVVIWVNKDVSGKQDVDHGRCRGAILPDKFVDDRYATADAFGVLGTPALFLLDRDGRVLWRHIGRMVWNKVEADFRKALAQ